MSDPTDTQAAETQPTPDDPILVEEQAHLTQIFAKLESIRDELTDQLE